MSPTVKPTRISRLAIRSALVALALIGASHGASAQKPVWTPPHESGGPHAGAVVTPVEKERLTIGASAGPVRYAIELRDTPAARATGLMHRPSMPADHGMLFDFGDSIPVDMWMQNTLIPLDMLFIRADGRIARIAANTEPLSTRIISSGEPVRYVLELNGGEAARAGVRPGDLVSHPAIER